MSAAVDIINFHLYIDNEQPEEDLPNGSANVWIGTIKGILSAADSSKPLWNGEGSCATPTLPGQIWKDNLQRLDSCYVIWACCGRAV
jgi:hypothetical protein